MAFITAEHDGYCAAIITAERDGYFTLRHSAASSWAAKRSRRGCGGMLLSARFGISS